MSTDHRIAQVRTSVAATDLVRNYSHWQAEAARGPVEIRHHGRVRAVLTGIDPYNALVHAAAGTAGRDDSADQLAAVLDMVPTLFIQFGANLVVRRLNPAARRHLQVSDDTIAGLHFDTILPHPTAGLLRAVLERVIAGGGPEYFEAASMLYADRRMRLDIVPFADGCAIFSMDMTAEVDVKTLRARLDARDALDRLIPGVSSGTIDSRGVLAAIPDRLATLAGVDPRALTGLRFVSLIDVAHRGLCTDRIDAVLRGGEAVTFSSLLLARGGGRLVTIALAPLRGDTAVTGVAFTLVAASVALTA